MNIDPLKVFDEIRPYILDLITAAGTVGVSGAAAPSPHALFSGHHTGSLDDSQATQFLKTDGTRTLTGDMSVSVGKKIDGFDISALGALAFVTIGNDANVPNERALAGGAGISLTDGGAGGSATIAVDATVARSTWPLTAGAGLTGGGNLASGGVNLDVGAGLGITVNANDVALTTPGSLTASSTNSSSGNHTHAIDSTIARAARNLTAGAGLTGGGDLSADRTFDVGAGLGITVNANDVALTTPGTLTQSTSNSSSGSHTHAITTTTGAAASTIVATDASSGLALAGDMAVNGGDLTLSAATFNLLNSGVTTVNAFGATTSMRFGSGTGLSMAINKAVDTQFDLDVNGNFRAGGFIVGKHAIQLSGALLIAHYDGAGPTVPPFTDFTGEPTGHKGQVATVSGGVIYQSGKFGKAVQMAEATTNRVRNPTAGTNTTDWNSDATGFTLTRITTDGYNRSTCFKWHWISGAGHNLYQSAASTLANSTQYTVSCYMKRSDGAAVTGVQFYIDSTLSVINPTAITSVGNGWYYLYGTRTTSGATNQVVGVASLDTSVDWYLADFQCEQKAYPTPYCDGSLGPGHSWAGTADASQSSRTYTSLSYPFAGNINAASGSVSFWFYTQSMSGGVIEGIVDWMQVGVPGTNGFLLRSGAGGARTVAASIYAPGATTIATSAVTEGAWHYVVFTWDSTGCTIYVDGGSAAGGSQSTTANTFAAPSANLFVGFRNGGFDTANGLIDDLVILNRAMTAAEVRAVYESNAPVFAETSVFAFRDPTGNAWLDGNGLFGRWSNAGTLVPAFALLTASTNLTVIGGASETLDPGDIFIGDNNASKANLWWDASAGRINFRGGTTVQGYIDTTGAATFGAGAVTLDANGIRLATVSAYGGPNAITWLSGATNYAGLYEQSGSGSNNILLQANQVTGSHAGILIDAFADTNKDAIVSFAARNPTGGKNIQLDLNQDHTNGNYAALYSGGTLLGMVIGANALPRAVLEVRGSGIFTGGLNIGSATGAGTGELFASGDRYRGSDAKSNWRTKVLSIANNANAQLCPAATMNGLIAIVTSEGFNGVVWVEGGNHTTHIVSDPWSVFSVTAATASKNNVYWSAGNSRYEIENKRGSTLSYSVFCLVDT